MANQMLVRHNMREYFDVPIPNLRSYLRRQVEGQPDVYRTTFAKGEDVDEVLQQWSKTIEGLSTKWPSLYAFESEMRAKVGPLSVQKPLRERMDDILSYYNLVELPREPLSDEAVRAVINEWSRLRGLRLRSVDETVRLMKLSTNSGSPYFTKRSRVLEKTIPYKIHFDGERTYIWLPGFEGYACAVLGWRGQEGGPLPEDVKQRVLWMFSMVLNIEELRTYQPLIQGCQKLHLVPAWEGNDAVDQRVTRLFDTAEGDDIMCTDFAKYDQHFNDVMQNGSGQVLSGLGVPGEWITGVYPIKYHIPMVISWGLFTEGKHGMASGSGGTNADETIAHRILQHEAALSAGSTLNLNSMCLGDDGILSYHGITADHVLETYCAHGLEMNPSKQYVSKEDCVYLRRWHHRDYRRDGVCVGVYSTYRALGRLMMQERFIDPKKWGPKAVAMRQLSIMENCCYHPFGEEFIKFCIKRDKYRLGLDIPGFMDNLDAIYRESEANDTLYVSYSATFGNPKPPSKWWVVQKLKQMR